MMYRNNALLAAASLAVAALASGCASFSGAAPQTFDEQTCVERSLRRTAAPDSLPLAFRDFSKACADGVQSACSPLGIMYELGLATRPDPARAARLYQQACQAENVGGCLNLGLAYAKGNGVSADQRRARALFGWACEREHPVACRELGTLFVNGLGGAPEPGRGAQLYQSACDLGDGEACTRLAGLYERNAWRLNAGKALDLYEKGCVLGNAEGCDGVERIEARATAIGKTYLGEAAAAGGSTTAFAR